MNIIVREVGVKSSLGGMEWAMERKMRAKGEGSQQYQKACVLHGVMYLIKNFQLQAK